MTFALMTPRTKQGYKSSWLVEWGWHLECSRVQRHLLFQIALFFIDNRNSVLCGIPILQLHLQYELVKQTKNMRLVEFHNHLDEFHRLKGLNLQEQVYSSVCLLIALYQILTHRAFLSLPAEPDGATHMQRLFWHKYLQHALPLLYFICPKHDAVLECSTQTPSFLQLQTHCDKNSPDASHDVQTPLVLQQKSRGGDKKKQEEANKAQREILAAFMAAKKWK